MDQWGVVTILAGAVLIILALGLMFNPMAFGSLLADVLVYLLYPDFYPPSIIIIIGIGAICLGAYGIRAALKD